MIRRPPRSTPFPTRRSSDLLQAVRPDREVNLAVHGRCHVDQAVSEAAPLTVRSEEHTSELQSRLHLVCRLLLEKKKKNTQQHAHAVTVEEDDDHHKPDRRTI